MLITSWNEWHEGKEIEPSRQNGTSYLQFTRAWVDQYKHESMPPAGLPVIQAKVSSPVPGPTPGVSDVNITLTNEGSSPALFTNTTISSGQNTSVNGFVDEDFRAYFEIEGSNSYNVMIPLIMPGESVTIGALYLSSSSQGVVTVATQSFNGQGTPLE